MTSRAMFVSVVVCQASRVSSILLEASTKAQLVASTNAQMKMSTVAVAMNLLVFSFIIQCLTNLMYVFVVTIFVIVSEAHQRVILIIENSNTLLPPSG